MIKMIQCNGRERLSCGLLVGCSALLSRLLAVPGGWNRLLCRRRVADSGAATAAARAIPAPTCTGRGDCLQLTLAAVVRGEWSLY